MKTRNIIKIPNLLFLLLVSTFSLAQSVHYITLKPINIVIPKRQFKITSVIDSRPNKELIGFVQKGLSNRRIGANFKEPFESYLQKVFTQMLPFNQTMTPVIAKVHNLYISETTTISKEIGKVEIALEFLTTDSSNSYGLYHAIETNGGIDVTKKHGKRLLTALESCLLQLSKNWTSTPNQVPISSNTAFNPNTPLKKGLYNSFSDVRNNTPITDISFEIIKIFEKAELYKVQEKESKKKLKNIYAFSDGKDFYLNASQYSYERHFAKAEFGGTYFYFEDRISDTGASLMFGLIGALASEKKVGVVLDTQTGMINQLDRDFLARVLKDYPELRKMYNDTNKKLSAKKAILRKFNEVLFIQQKEKN